MSGSRETQPKEAVPPSRRRRYRPGWSRREFLRRLGGGILVLWMADRSWGQESGGGRARGRGRRRPTDVAGWLHIGEDGTVSVFTGKAEVGQNIRTSLTQAVAEELPVRPSAIRMVMADTDLVPWDAGTFGSRTTPDMNPQLRRAAAAAREALLDLAAEHFGVGRDALTFADGRIAVGASAAAVDIAELTRGRNLTRELAEESELRPASEWRVMGTSLAKVQGADFVTGRHRFASDVTRPGMLYGRVLRPSAYGAKLASLDDAAARRIDGVVVVREGDFVGVAAPDAVTAERAASAIRAEWDEPAAIAQEDLWSHLRATARNGGRGEIEHGSIERGWREAKHRLERTYTVAYIAHAPLEPRAAVAEWADGRLTVWTGTQRPFGVRSELARAFDLEEASVRVIVPDTGSAYGGKHTGEAAIEAARLARAARRPVKLVWSREEEFTWAYFRPAGIIEVRGGVRADGTLCAWQFENIDSGGAAIRTPYEVSNQSIRFLPADSPLRTGSYRGLAAVANNFARESHMDELAHAAGLDPLEFRLRNLREDRVRAVLERAAAKFGWGRKARQPGRGFGLACGTEKGSCIATCVELAVEEDGTIALRRIVSAFECGAVVNPEHVLNQAEGAIVQGLGGALFEQVRFGHGRVLNPRFSQYRLPRFRDLPKLETEIVDRPDLRSAGAGETPIMAVAPAIANALFDATGKRSRSLPLRPEKPERAPTA